MMRYLAPINQNGPLLTTMDNSGNLQTFNIIGDNNAYGVDSGRPCQGNDTNNRQGSTSVPAYQGRDMAVWDALPGDRFAGF